MTNPPPLTSIAETYKAACDRGDPPTRAVATAFGRPYGTAARWVTNARNSGLLPPTSKGASPKRNRALVAASNDLGIPYEQLREAVIRHNLRADTLT